MDEDQILEEAQAAFWEVISRLTPQVKTGDFPPDATFAFDDACKSAYHTWLDLNDDTRPET